MQSPRSRSLHDEETDEFDPADEYRSPKIPSLVAHVAVVACGVLAVGGMFLLPSLRSAGLSFLQSFLAVAAVEMTAGLGAGYAALHLYMDPDVF